MSDGQISDGQMPGKQTVERILFLICLSVYLIMPFKN